VERAVWLLRSGRRDDAQLVVDAIVLANPLFEPASNVATPPLMAAVQTSRQMVLPPMARRDLEKAREWMRDGDYEAAQSEASRLARMLAVLDDSSESRELRADVQQVMASASLARASEEQRVYSNDDVDVTPPTAIGRQLPAELPEGIARPSVGTLELVIGKEGEVESVRLHTPMNRYHERMIVSAAKAWRYKPALRNGKPVRFRLVSSITLPES
jgi:hypothetical protein